MDCTYEMLIEGKKVKISSLLDLAKYYYAFGGTLESRRIFSSSDDVDSVIKKFLTRIDDIKNDSSKVAVNDFVVDEKPELFKSMNLTKTRLTPKYIEENRIVSHLLGYLKNYIGIEIKSLKELENAISGKEELVKIFNEQLKEIKDKIEVEQVTKNLSIDIHKGLEKIIRGEDISNAVEYIIGKNKEIFNDIKSWRSQLTSSLTTISKQLTNLMGPNGHIYTELQVDSSETASVGIKGTIDILVIDSTGKAHIFDLKVSKDKYNKWDSAKVLKTDWQMAFYRGILSQYIPSNPGDITLNIIPISIGEIERDEDKDGNVKYTAYADRLYDEDQVPLLGFPDKGLHENGVMTKTVSTILPPLMTIEKDEESLRQFNAELGLLLPNYEIKTTNAEYNVESIVEAAVKNNRFEINNNLYFETNEMKNRLEAIGVYEQNYKFIFDSEGMTLSEKTEKFRKAVEIYVEYAKKHKTTNIRSLKNSIKNSINSKHNSITWGNKEVQVKLNNLLKPYLLGNYKLIDAIQELDDLGLILLQNTSNNDYIIFSITSFSHEANYNNDLLFGDLEYIKAMFFIDKFKDVLKVGKDRNKIEAINIFNLNSGTYFYRPLAHQINKYSSLVKSRTNLGLKTDLNSFDYLRKPEEVARQIIKNVLRGFVGTDSDKNAISNILEPIVNQTVKDDMSNLQLKEIFREFLEKFPRLKKMENKLSFTDDTEYLFAMLGYLIVLKEGLTPFGDAIYLKDFALSFADFKSIFMPLVTDKQASYDKDGKKIQGVIGGLNTGTPDKMYSADLRNVNSAINNTTAYVRQVFYKQSTVLNKLTRQYFKDIAYTPSEQNWLGNYRSKFEPLWEKENGDISNAWRVKNPYATDVKNGMNDAERKFLKEILFEINRWRLGISDKEKIDLTSLESLAKTSAGAMVLKDIEDGKYFSMPLVRNQQITRGASLYRTGSDKVKLLIQESSDFFDGRELEEDDRINISKNNLGLYEMYNIYEMQLNHPSIIKDHVNKNGVQYYELNLDIIAHRVAFNKIRQNAVNNILPTIVGYMNWMKLRAGIPNENISNILEYVSKRIKLALEDSPIVEDEFKDIVTAIAPVKAITTAGMLAFRPTLFFKELAIGLYKGIALAATKIYGKQQFGVKSYIWAVKELATIDNKFGTQWNLIDAFNNFYGFANRDVNSGAQRLQTNRRGILMGLSPWMYSTSTLPDYYNRLSLFLAKTKEDGCYEAHSVVDGFLYYDPRKDKRFSLYFEKRESYKNSQGKYIPAKDNEEYNKQRNLYTLTMNEINDVLTRQGEKKLEEVDLIPQAYSEKENLSFRSFIDTVYGYYNKDSTSLIHQTWYGIIFLQFMQFWPGKMSQWFGKGIDASESLMGDHVQASIERDGKKILLWKEPVYSEVNPDEIIDYRTVEENTGDPLIEWVGTPQEGLMQSILKSLRYIVTGDMGKFKSDELLKKRAIFGLADGALMMLIFGMFAALLQAWMDENGTDGIDGQTIAFANNVNKRILSESNVFQNTFGALNSTPAFWGYGSKVINDMVDVVEGDETIQNFSKNVKAFEIFNQG